MPPKCSSARFAHGRSCSKGDEITKRTVRELHGQMIEMRRQMAEMQRLLKTFSDQKREDQ